MAPGNCGIRVALILFWIQFNFLNLTVQSKSVTEVGVKVLERHLRFCCSKQLGYTNGECELNANVAADLGLNLELPTHLLIYDNLSSDSLDLDRTQPLQLRLKTTPGLPICKNGRNILSIPILASGNETIVESVDTVGRFDLVGSVIYNNQTYDPKQYCINRLDKEKLEIVVCNAECSNNSDTTCIRKCCKNGEHLKVGDNRLTCVPSNGKKWAPKLHHNADEVLTNDEQSKRQIQFDYSHPSLGWCAGAAYFMYQKDYPDNPKIRFQILKDGNVVQEAPRGKWAQLLPQSYCLEGVYPENDTLLDDEFQESVGFVCPPAVELETSERRQLAEVYWSLAVVSSFFVLITIIVYGLLWETQNIHGWTLLSFFTSLFFLYVFLASMYIVQLYFPEDIGSLYCWSIGVALHFSYLSTFCWMTALNFDLWCTFRNLRRSNKTSKKFKRFSRYALFGVGIPCVILGIAITLDFLSKSDGGINAITPQYGVTRCFLDPHEASLVFLYGPISGLLSVNLIFFLLTVRAMYEIKKVASIATTNCTNGSAQSVNIFGKLFVVMGVSWIFEVITWATHPTSVPWWCVALDVLNFCHGILIFIIFVCKRSTVRSLEQKYPTFKKFTAVISELTGSLQSKFFCSCCQPRSLERSFTLESTIQELEQRRKSNDTDEDLN